jgi:hypothetical protein
MRSSATPKEENHEKHPVEIFNDLRRHVRVRLQQVTHHFPPDSGTGATEQPGKQSGNGSAPGDSA